MRIRRSVAVLLVSPLLALACTKSGSGGPFPPFSVSPPASVAGGAAELPNDVCPRPGCTQGTYSGLPIDGAWIDAIGLPEAWSVTHGGGVTVVLLDLGVSQLEDLKGKVQERIEGRGLAATLDPEQAAHGNAMASIIAADTDNGRGIAGVGWDTTIVSVDMGETYAHFAALGPERRWDRRHIVDLFGQAAAIPGVRIISFSSVVNPSASLEREIGRIVDAGVLVVAGAGNEEQPGVTTPRYPAAYEGVIGVGGAVVAPDGSVGIWGGSNVGAQVDVYSPTFVPALVGPGNVELVAGTSPATALTSGVLALLLSEYPELTPPQVERMLVQTGTPFPSVYTTRDLDTGNVVTLPGLGPAEPRLIDAAALFAAAAALGG